MDTHKQIREKSRGNFKQPAESVLQFHLSNLEFACGCDLDEVSAYHWDQNEAFPQFPGPHCIMVQGYSKILNKLRDGLDVRLNAKVSEGMPVIHCMS